MKKGLIVLISVLLSGCTSSTQNTGKTTVSSDEIRGIIQSKEYSLVYFWASWCGVCRKTMAETLPEIQTSLDKNKTQLVVIAANNNSKKIDNLVYESGLKTTPYHLDFFGPDTWLLQKNKLKETFTELFPTDKVWNNSIPVFILVDRNMRVIDAELPRDLPALKTRLAQLL